MKSVKITIKGDLIIVDYCSQSLIDEENEFNDSFYVTGCWEKIDGMYINDDEENVVKKKGKYLLTKEYFHDLFSEDGDHPLPVEVHSRGYQNQELEYNIRLKDDEEFDIKKVQLVKSDYECSLFPYFIVCTHILYDGKEIYNYDYGDDYCPEEKIYDEAVIEELYD